MRALISVTLVVITNHHHHQQQQQKHCPIKAHLFWNMFGIGKYALARPLYVIIRLHINRPSSTYYCECDYIEFVIIIIYKFYISFHSVINVDNGKFIVSVK